MAQGYTDALARIHHEGFSEFAELAGPEIVRLLRRAGVRRGRLVDLGCGSGVWARQAAGAGFAVLGIDVSPGMLRLARREAPTAEFRCESLWRTRLPACDVVTALGEPLNYRFDGGNTRGGRQRLFARIRRALRPGGVFVADVATVGMLALASPRRYLMGGRDWAVMTETATDAGERTLTRRCVSFLGEGARHRRVEEVHRQWLFDPAELRADLERAGFGVTLEPRYGRYRLLPGRVAIVARAGLLE